MTGTAEEQSPSSEPENSGDMTESGTVSPENSAPSGTSENSRTAPENSSETESIPEENPEMVGPMNPSHKISGSLMESLAEYYSEGNWIPDLSFALPADFAEKILGESLSDFWGMEPGGP